MLMIRRLIISLLIINVIKADDIVTNRKVIHRLVGGHIRILPDELNDAELILSESGGRTNRQQKLNEDEDKKTLSQQVADGKYGLIQKELFSKSPKRPGVLSYDNNSDIPKDNISNLGGLDKNDIWLAENHLLVLKGGHYPPHDDRAENAPSVWPPIDNFKAPNRQVKIPSHPKVPPPFPVQLTDEGPLQILGTNSSRTINATFKPAPYPVLPSETFTPDSGPYIPPPYPYPPNITSGETPFPISPYAPGDYIPGNGPPPPFPYPINGTFPPFFGNLPPGVAFLPPPDNLTEPIDEDDPSIYYPPPYSFYYPTDNSTQVPPGPLVPGIVLPPPPNFFAPLEEINKTKEKSATPKRITTMRTTTEPTKQIHPTTTPLPPTSVINSKPTNIPSTVTENDAKFTTTAKPHVVTSITVVNRVKPNRTVVLVTTRKPYTPVERRPSHRRKPTPAVTILKPVKTPTTPVVNYYEQNEVSGKPFNTYIPQTTTLKARTLVTTTQVPLKSYFSTSNEIDTNSVTRGPESHYPTINANKSPSQFYFYEENSTTRRLPTTYSQSQAKSFSQPQAKSQPQTRTYSQPSLSETYSQPPQSETYSQPQSEIYSHRQETYSQPKTSSYIPSKTRIYSQPQPPSAYSQPKPISYPERNEQSYLNIPKEYYIPAREIIRQPQRLTPVEIPQQSPDYYYVNQQVASPSTPKPDTFSIHIARLKGHIDTYYTTPRPRKVAQSTAPTSKPVYQFSFEANNYKQQQNNYRNQGEDSQDKFRPIPRYSVEIQPAVEVVPTERPVYQKNPLPQLYFQPKQQTNTERPTSTEYYTTPEYDYNYRDKQYVITPKPITQYSFEATPNPIYQQGYYTKQDERLFDDITKKYFTVFGQKLSNTSPIPSEEGSTEKPYTQQYLQENIKPIHIEYAQSVGKQVPLHGDTYVNYVGQNTPNPNAEYVPIRPQPPKFIQRQREHSLHSDINVNYKRRRPQNQNAELIEAINVPLKSTQQETKSGSYISYELPGDDGAHFYFITPQLANRRNQGIGYYYSQPSNPRAKRNNRGRGS